MLVHACCGPFYYRYSRLQSTYFIFRYMWVLQPDSQTEVSHTAVILKTSRLAAHSTVYTYALHLLWALGSILVSAFSIPPRTEKVDGVEMLLRGVENVTK